MVDLPEGFVLDSPAPPPGFVPDSPQAEEQPEFRFGGFLPIKTDVKTGERFFEPGAGVLGSIIDAVTLPGDVFEGRVDPLSPEGIARAGNFALTAAPASAASRTVAVLPKTKPKLRNVEELRAAKNAAYERSEAAGVTLSQAGYARLAERVVNSIKDQPFSARLHPKINAAILETGDRLGRTPTLRDVDVLRQIIAEAGKSTSKSERRLASRMIGALDDFVRTLNAKNIVAGDIDAAVPALFEARKIAATTARAEAIEELFERAGLTAGNFTGSGFENALRTEFRNFAKNKRKMRGFSDQERKAIELVAKGTRKGNLARNIGRLAPTGPVNIGLAIGGSAVSPALATLPVAGAFGRIAATRSTRKNLERVRRAVQRQDAPGTTRRLLAGTKRTIDRIVQRPITEAEALDAVLGP